MADEILSLAIFEPLPGNEEAAFATILALISALSKKGYSKDVLYRNTKSRHEYILLRHWKSEQARQQALEDPEILRHWAELSQQIRTIRVYERLEEAVTRMNGSGSSRDL